MKEGAYITIRNVNSNVYREHIRLEIDKWAKVEVMKADGTKPKSVNLTNNVSDTAYELVATGGNNRY